ncbi:MAG: hypothetical protein K8T10_15925 [Candidatus Eremiobacteraeota bacterium]|nr:hypothetical protein [Candidatus Eremiobacteraeota bacterium]
MQEPANLDIVTTGCYYTVKFEKEDYFVFILNKSDRNIILLLTDKSNPKSNKIWKYSLIGFPGNPQIIPEQEIPNNLSNELLWGNICKSEDYTRNILDFFAKVGRDIPREFKIMKNISGLLDLIDIYITDYDLLKDIYCFQFPKANMK